MSRTLVLILCALTGMAAARAALANDSTAEMAAGGLVLKQTRHIDMVSEDLYVSVAEIRVRYVFRNRARRDVRTIVAFPMPDRDLRRESESDTGWPDDFRTTVDGRPIRMRVERKAMARGVDHSPLLAGLGVPIVPEGDDGVAAIGEALARLPRGERDRLAALGLFETEGRRLTPAWTVKETWYWEQAFPAGRPLVVTHRYTPGAGGTVTTLLGNRELRASGPGREHMALYCVDSEFLAAVDRLHRRTGTEYATIAETWLSYILTTGANWGAPIGDFRLVVDKGAPENLVSFCGEGVRRIGPTRFEMRRRNWRPTRDLRVLILRPYRFDE
ncbi:MAG TPA: DUF4424 domain-containing protein [Allosphingosinicella sp.]|nr:DUF4424 domain-containing protein [Allosphingosinicella sp.]